MMATTNVTPAEHHITHLQAGRRIEYLTIAWTPVEAAVGIATGLLAGSIALVGFGIDSVIEVISSGVLLWRLSDRPGAERREEVAQRLVGISFLMLAAYVSIDAVHDLISHQTPQKTYFGIAFAGACIIIMPL